ncbi:hypothetical protein MMC17_007652 [Xylographa soralifera]|nr:hypothetical protein [Xylographa soralifera]
MDQDKMGVMLRVTVLMDAALGHESPESAGIIWTKIEKPSLMCQSGKGEIKEIYRFDSKDKKNPNLKYPYLRHESPGTSLSMDKKEKLEKLSTSKPSTKKPNDLLSSKPDEPSEPPTEKSSTTKPEKKPGKKTVLRRLAAARKASQGFELPRRYWVQPASFIY